VEIFKKESSTKASTYRKMTDETTRLPCSTLGAWLPTASTSSTRGGTRLENDDKYDYKKAKQRASIKWLLSKAYDHKTPAELREPFYKDNDVSFMFIGIAIQYMSDIRPKL
jgi:hypothetical protein